MAKEPTYEDAIEYFDLKIEKAYEKVSEEGYDKLAKNEKMIYLVFALWDDTRNGGMAKYLMGEPGTHHEDLIEFLRELQCGAIAKDLAALAADMKEICPDFPKGFFDALDDCGPERQEQHYTLNTEVSRRLFEYDPTLPQMLFSFQKKK